MSARRVYGSLGPSAEAFLRVHGTSSVQDIAANLQIAVSHCSALLSSLKKKQLVENVQRGQWKLGPASVAWVKPLPAVAPEHTTFRARIEAMMKELLTVDEPMLFVQIECHVAAVHLERALDWLDRNAKPQLATPFGGESRREA